MSSVPPKQDAGALERLLAFCIDRPLIILLGVLAVIGWGLLVAPFDLPLAGLPRDPVPVDAIPDIGENQQIVFTEWMGRSPQDIEDQITYPLTVSLLGIPGVKTVRSASFFGFSSIYLIFEEDVEFYWSRSRILEKLSSLPAGTLPAGTSPALGPDATALGQVFWYTLEGLDPDGQPTGGWGLDELRSVQDWTVRYALLSANGVAEVAAVGGFVSEYQIDVDPDAMRAYDIALDKVFAATEMSNRDVGARTIEVNNVEYVVRGLGFLEGEEDLRQTVVDVRDNVPITIGDIATVGRGPGFRRGALDKAGAEAVGGVVVTRYGANPLEVIGNVKAKIGEIAAGLPARAVMDPAVTTRAAVERFAQAREFDAFAGSDLHQELWVPWLRSHARAEWPAGITLSQITIVPFYDRTGLIHETLGTLQDALFEEMLITAIVVLVMVFHLRSSLLVSALLPLAVLMCFIAMKMFGVAANIVALSGIAIAIGTMVDTGVIVSENILRHLTDKDDDEPARDVVLKATREVGGAVMTAVATTIVGFLPVFTMTGAEGKLFRPLAFTKTFALLAAILVALIVIPSVTHLLVRSRRPRVRWLAPLGLIAAGALLAGGGLLDAAGWVRWAGVALIAAGLVRAFESRLGTWVRKAGLGLIGLMVIGTLLVLLTEHWLPLGSMVGMPVNLLFVGGLIGVLLLIFLVYQRVYPHLLRWCLDHKPMFLTLPVLVVLAGASTWLGFETVFAAVPRAADAVGLSGNALKQSQGWRRLAETFPGLGQEFMPPLDEGSYLFMPTTMPHASIGEALDVLRRQDAAIAAIPEVQTAVGKLGRAETPLDPAPVSMIETVISLVPEYASDEHGHRLTYRYDETRGEHVRDADGLPIPDADGRPLRLWRDHITKPDDVWDEILRAAELPGTTSAPRLQPIAARLVMLQTGIRAPMGVKIKGPTQSTIEATGVRIEQLLKQVPGVEPTMVNADRLVGKPYIEIDLDRAALARYGLHVEQVQRVIEVAIGGRRVTTTVEGRERYPVRVRYPRELREDIGSLGRVIVPTPQGAQIPLAQLAEIRFVRGPQAIKSEDTFLVGYVVFDKQPGFAEVDVVEACQRHLEAARQSGELQLPAGVSYTFTGNYENQVRSQKTLAVVLPLALFLIFVILYLQFSSVLTTAIVFSGIAVAWAGGFLLLWCYAQPGFLDLEVFGTQMRELFGVHPINLSVAVWVGFLALFGIASDDGVLMATYIDQSFAEGEVHDRNDVRARIVHAAQRRIRPALMTTATTILALLPVLTSTGRGSDIMVPMALPSVGGMVIAVMTTLVVPVLACLVRERCLERSWPLSLDPLTPS